MKNVDMNELRSIEGGKTFYCPFCRRNGIERKFTTSIINAIKYDYHLRTCIYRNR